MTWLHEFITFTQCFTFWHKQLTDELDSVIQSIMVEWLSSSFCRQFQLYETRLLIISAKWSFAIIRDPHYAYSSLWSHSLLLKHFINPPAHLKFLSKKGNQLNDHKVWLFILRSDAHYLNMNSSTKYHILSGFSDLRRMSSSML